MLHKPRTWKDIAQEQGISARQAQEIYADFQRWDIYVKDPLASVDEAIAFLTALLEELGREILNGDNSNARVGASRAALEVLRQRIELQQAAGRMPRNLHRFRAEAAFVDISRQMIEVMRRRGVAPEVLAEVRDVTERYIPPARDNHTKLGA